MMKKILWLTLSVIAVFLLVISVNTLLFNSKQESVPEVDLITVDSKGASKRLAKALRIPTISHQDQSQVDTQSFLDFHQFLLRSFPALHQTLDRRVINNYSLLYKWQGSDPSLKPIAILAHSDVVPLEPGTEANWTHGAFDGVISDGYVWGRGALDMKGILMASMEAVEELVKQDFTPQRTIYLAFGHDEELGGLNGALKIAEDLKEKGVQLAFTLDEGLAIADRELSPVDAQTAVIGLAEKGHVTLKVSVTNDGGHSSMPPLKTTIGILSRAVYKLEENQMPATLSGPIGLTYDYLVPEMSLLRRVLFANRWLFEGTLVKLLGKSTTANAGIRTTTAPVIFQGGVKENILPTKAHALVNFRIKPGDTVADVLNHAQEVIDDSAVDVSVNNEGHLPSPVSSVNSQGFKTIQRSILEVFPGTIIAPGLVLGGTDSKHYAMISEDNYRFAPMILGPTDTKRIHATNERIGVDNYEQMIQFYIQLIKNIQHTLD